MKWRFKDEEDIKRPVVQVSLGCHIDGVAMMKPDLTDTWSTVKGIQKRFLAKPPPFEPALLGEFKQFVRKYIRNNFQPLPSTTDVSVDTWLKGTIYPDWRKQQLKEQWDAVDDPWGDVEYRYCSSFVKDETYPTWKYPRIINSRSDVFKCMVGPIFQAISDEVFKHEAFIKKIPIDKRPEYIKNLVHKHGSKYLATDYTAFEAQFIKAIMEACEFELYSYMTENLPEHHEFMRAINCIGGLNHCVFKNIRVLVEATRMSGEMCTSLGNGFSNLMFMLFIAFICGCTGVQGVVEGDDGLFSMSAGETGHYPERSDFARLGLDIKPEWHDQLETASFCGIIFAPEDGHNLADPRKLMANFGWTSRKYARSKASVLKQLLRAKSLSMAYQYPGCPIAKALSRYGLRVTSGVNVSRRIVDSMGEWPKRVYLEAISKAVPDVEIGSASRALVERMWGITASAQMKIESYLDQLTTIRPLKLSWIDDIMPDSWKQYFGTYSATLRINDIDLDHPYPVWRHLKGSLNHPKTESPIAWDRPLIRWGVRHILFMNDQYYRQMCMP